MLCCVFTVFPRQVGTIILDYKLNLLWKTPENSPNYWELKKRIHERSAVRLRDLCCKNGGVFIKVGQHLGSLDYLIPDEYVRAMRVLQDQAPKAEFEDVLLVLREELKRDVSCVHVCVSEHNVGCMQQSKFVVALTAVRNFLAHRSGTAGRRIARSGTSRDVGRRWHRTCYQSSASPSCRTFTRRHANYGSIR